MKASDTKTANATVQANKTGAPLFFSPEKGDSVLENSPAFFGENTGSGAFFSPPPPVQAKLTIGAPDDPYEREADATAEKVVQRLALPDAPALSEPVHSIQRMPAPVQRACAECEQEEQKEAEEQIQEKVQRKAMFETPVDGEGGVQRKCDDCEQEDQGGVQRQADGATQTSAPANFSAQLQSSKGGGSALPAEVSSQMGQAMGADFSGVRVHTGNEAAEMSQSIQAQAFTHGSDIYFNEGKYDTGSTDGQKLLAHELTHTVQQGGAGVKRAPNTPKKSTIPIQKYKAAIVFNRKQFEYDTQLVDMLWWVAGVDENRELRKEILKQNAINNEFCQLVEEAQKKVYSANQKYEVGKLDVTTKDLVKKAYQKQGGKVKEFKVLNEIIYGFAKDAKGVNLRSSPHQMSVGEMGEAADNLVENLPFGSSFRILAETTDPKEGWLKIQLPTNNKIGYVASYLVTRKNTGPSKNAFLYTIRNSDFDHVDAFGKLVKGQASAIKIARKFYKGGNVYDFLRIMLEYNSSNPGFYLPAGLNPSNTADLNKIVVWEGYNIWMPTEAYVYTAIVKIKGSTIDILSKINNLDDIASAIKTYGSKEAALAALQEYNQRAKLQQQSKEFEELRNIISHIDPVYIEELKDLTGMKWSEFAAMIVSPIAYLSMEATNQVRWEALNYILLKKYGITADQIVKTITYFRDMVVGDSDTVLSLANGFIRDEKIRLNNKEYLDKLFSLIGKANEEYLKADEMRAEEMLKYYREKGIKVQIGGIAINMIKQISIFNDFLNQEFNQVLGFLQSNDKKSLTKHLHHRDPSLAFNIIFALEHILSIEATITTFINPADAKIVTLDLARQLLLQYPSLVYANIKDKVTTENLTNNIEDFPIFLDQNIDWRSFSNSSTSQVLKTRIESYFNKRLQNIQETRQNIHDDPDIIWEFKPLVVYSMTARGMDEKSTFGQLVLDKYEDVDRENTMISIGLAVLTIGLIIAGFFTGGATWVGVGLIAGGVAVSVVDLVREINQYNIHSAASNTSVGGIFSLSDKDPSVWGIVFAILGLGLDVVDLLKAGGKALKVITEVAEAGEISVKSFDELFEALQQKGLKMTKDELRARLSQEVATVSRLHNSGVFKTVKELFTSSGVLNAPDELIMPYAKLYELDEVFAKSLITTFSENKYVLGVLGKQMNSSAEGVDHLLSFNKFFKQTGKSQDEVNSLLKHLATDGQHTLNRLPNLVKRINATVINDGNLIENLFRHGGLQNVFLKESDEKILELWTKYQAQLSAGTLGKPTPAFFKFVDNEGLASFHKTTQQIREELAEQATKEFDEASKKLQQHVSTTFGSGLPLSNEIIAATVDLVKAAVKKGFYKGEGLINLIKNSFKQATHNFENLDPNGIEAIVKNLVSDDPKFIAREIILAGYDSKSGLVDTVTKLLQEGTVKPEALEQIFKNAQTIKGISHQEFLTIFETLLTQKLDKFQELVNLLSNPNAFEATTEYLIKGFDANTGLLSKIDDAGKVVNDIQLFNNLVSSDALTGLSRLQQGTRANLIKHFESQPDILERLGQLFKKSDHSILGVEALQAGLPANIFGTIVGYYASLNQFSASSLLRAIGQAGLDANDINSLAKTMSRVRTPGGFVDKFRPAIHEAIAKKVGGGQVGYKKIMEVTEGLHPGQSGSIFEHWAKQNIYQQGLGRWHKNASNLPGAGWKTSKITTDDVILNPKTPPGGFVVVDFKHVAGRFEGHELDQLDNYSLILQRRIKYNKSNEFTHVEYLFSSKSAAELNKEIIQRVLLKNVSIYYVDELTGVKTLLL